MKIIGHEYNIVDSSRDPVNRKAWRYQYEAGAAIDTDFADPRYLFKTRRNFK
jgi:hypothetical protein